MNKKRAFFFNSVEPPEEKREFFVKDVVRSTAAAPTYFPPAVIKNLVTDEVMTNIDGGVFANNPTMCAYAECSNFEFPEVKNPRAQELLILSIGTGGGRFDMPNLQKSSNWGVVDWAKLIPSIMMDGSIDTVDYQMKNLFGTLEAHHQFNYKRVDVPLAARTYSTDMANASKENINALKDAGKAALDAALLETESQYGLDKFIQLLVDNGTEKNATNSVAKGSFSTVIS
ncbi:MAG: hypothetical protein JKY54_12245 [Flavobacteriales bacterium]|nr:hypothetical protein [Flavobacteriales bacterium]